MAREGLEIMLLPPVSVDGQYLLYARYYIDMPIGRLLVFPTLLPIVQVLSRVCRYAIYQTFHLSL